MTEVLMARRDEIAASYQPLNSNLTAIAGLTPTDSNFIVGNGTAWVAESGATARASLGLGTAATYNTGTSGATVPLLGNSNTWSATQNMQGLYMLAVGEEGGEIVLAADPNTANQPAVIDVYSNSIRFFSAYSAVGGNWFIDYINGGVYHSSAAGGMKGLGTINATAVYDDNVLLTCYVLEAELSGQVTPATWDGYTLDLEIPEEPEQVRERPITRKALRRQCVRDGARIVERLVEVDEPVYDDVPVVDELGAPVLHSGAPVVERVQRTERVVRPAQPARTEVRTHEPARRFATRAAELLDPAQYAASWRAAGHLPSMPSPAEWDAAGKKMAVGDIVQRLWETVELQAVHIDKLRQRIEALEATRRKP